MVLCKFNNLAAQMTTHEDAHKQAIYFYVTLFSPFDPRGAITFLGGGPSRRCLSIKVEDLLEFIQADRHLEAALVASSPGNANTSVAAGTKRHSYLPSKGQSSPMA
jgi:hypothetical protein